MQEAGRKRGGKGKTEGGIERKVEEYEEGKRNKETRVEVCIMTGGSKVGEGQYRVRRTLHFKVRANVQEGSFEMAYLRRGAVLKFFIPSQPGYDASFLSRGITQGPS